MWPAFSSEEWILLGTLLVLIWQAWLGRREIRKGAIRNIYDRWLEINRLEVEHPTLHRMFMSKEVFAQLDQSDDEEIRTRALSLFIFDQFAMIYNLGERQSRLTLIDPLVRRILRSPRLREWWLDYLDRRRTLLDINQSYIEAVMANPLVRRCWTELRLGETWKGSRFYEFVESAIAKTTSPELINEGKG